MSNVWEYITGGIPDQYFIRGKVPMTKEEIRSIVLAKLRLKSNSVLVDVGAGTGSVSIEGALICSRGMVYSLEQKEEAIALLEENIASFGVENIVIYEGTAGDHLDKLPPFDRMFIGGSGGEMEKIVAFGAERLPQGGRLVITSVTVESTALGLKLLKDYGFGQVEAISVSVVKGRSAGRYTLMEAQNPITILSATQEIEA